MPSLKTQLSSKLDVSSLVGGFVSNVSGPAGSLTAIADPTPASSISDIHSQIGGLNTDSISGTVDSLAQAATSIVGSLPIGGDIVKPITDALALIESVSSNPGIGDLESGIKSLLDNLSGILEGPRDGGFIGALHAAVTALTASQEGGAISSLLQKLTGSGSATIPSVPVTDAIEALDGAVRVVGGLMVLDAVTSDVERLTGLMAARLDPRALDRGLSALEAQLTFDGGELSDAMASVDVTDLNKVQRVVGAVVATAAALDGIRDEYSAAMGLGEATLVYLDIDKLSAELDQGRDLIRTGDLAPVNRIATQLAGALQPFLKTDLLAGPTQDLDALFANVESRLAVIAGDISGLDVAGLVSPLADGMKVLTSPIDKVTALLDQVRVAYQGALGSVKDAVAALPIKSIADAIHAILAPISAIVDALRALIADVMAALKTATDAVKAALGTIEGFVDDLQHQVEALFTSVKTFVDSLHIDQALGAVADGIKQVASALQQARMQPYFDTAASAINTAADVISKVPFDLIPDSMKADVDAAVAPIKNADATQLETEVESLLQITPDGHFAALGELDAAVAQIQAAYNDLIAEIKKHDPHTALADVDTKMHELSTQISALSPALALQSVRDAIDSVKSAIAGLDLDAPLAPVRNAFASIVSAVDGFKPSTLLGPVEDRITAARTQVISLLKLDAIDSTLDDVHTRAQNLLNQYNADLIQQRLQLAMNEFLSLFDNSPKLQLMSGLGAIVSGLVSGMGLRVYPHGFDSVLAWLDNGQASADLNARVVNAGGSMAAALATVGSLDFQSRVATASARAGRVKDAVAALVAKVGADSPAGLGLDNAAPRLDAGSVFGGLETNRTRFAAELADANTRIQAIATTGFSDADTRVANLKASIAPLDPARTYVRQLLQKIGLTGFELGIAGVLRAFFNVVTPARLVGLVRPILDALKERIQALVDAVLAPLKAGIASVRAALDAIDLTPLLDALDAIHTEVLAQINLLSPDALLGPTLTDVKALQATLVGADPLAPVLDILNTTRDTIARVLAKLSLESILAVPLAIYDELLNDLSQLDVAKLIAPLRAELDDLASQVDQGLDETVASFQRLQASLPGGGGGSSGGTAVAVG